MNFPLPGPIVRKSSGSPRTVLVADDNIVNQRVAAMTLKRLGFSCTIAANGREAVDAWAIGQYCAILMDCQMPQVDGFEATTEIRARERGERGGRTPIFAMTASDIPDDREKCRAAGMDGYLTKPLTPDEVALALGEPIEPVPAPWTRLTLPEDAMDPPLDRQTVDNLRCLAGEGEPDPFPEIAARFLQQGTLRMARLQAEPSTEEVATQAHSLRGMSGTIGAKRLARLCATLEHQARLGDRFGLDGLTDAVWFEFQCVRSALQNELRRRDAQLAAAC